MALLVPVIGVLVKGSSYDFVEGMTADHDVDGAQHPIEDPSLSYALDHNTKRPHVLQINFEVSENSFYKNAAVTGSARLLLVRTILTTLSELQVIDPTALLTVIEGTTLYTSMRIARLSFSRTNDEHQILKISMDLEQTRITRNPWLPSSGGLTSSTTPISSGGSQFVNPEDFFSTVSPVTSGFRFF